MKNKRRRLFCDLGKLYAIQIVRSVSKSFIKTRALICLRCRYGGLPAHGGSEYWCQRSCVLQILNISPCHLLQKTFPTPVPGGTGLRESLLRPKGRVCLPPTDSGGQQRADELEIPFWSCCPESEEGFCTGHKGLSAWGAWWKPLKRV